MWRTTVTPSTSESYENTPESSVDVETSTSNASTSGGLQQSHGFSSGNESTEYDSDVTLTASVSQPITYGPESESGSETQSSLKYVEEELSQEATDRSGIDSESDDEEFSIAPEEPESGSEESPHEVPSPTENSSLSVPMPVPVMQRSSSSETPQEQTEEKKPKKPSSPIEQKVSKKERTSPKSPREQNEEKKKKPSKEKRASPKSPVIDSKHGIISRDRPSQDHQIQIEKHFKKNRKDVQRILKVSQENTKAIQNNGKAIGKLTKESQDNTKAIQDNGNAIRSLKNEFSTMSKAIHKLQQVSINARSDEKTAMVNDSLEKKKEKNPSATKKGAKNDKRNKAEKSGAKEEKANVKVVKIDDAHRRDYGGKKVKNIQDDENVMKKKPNKDQNHIRGRKDLLPTPATITEETTRPVHIHVDKMIVRKMSDKRDDNYEQYEEEDDDPKIRCCCF